MEFDGNFSHIISVSSKYSITCVERERMKLGIYSIYTPKIPWLFNFVQMSDSIEHLLASINNGTALTVGDGSYFEDRMICTCGWIISSPDGEEWIKGGGYIPGREEDLNSYRGELGSLVGIVNCLEALQPLLTQSSNGIITASDNDSAVDCLWMRRHHIKASTKCFDLISSLIELWEIVPFHPIPTKVKGHADELTRSLSQLEKLNCIADAYAKEIALYYISHRPPENVSREVGVSPIRIQRSLVSSNLSKTLQNEMDKDIVCEYLAKDMNLCSKLLRENVGWLSVKRARKDRSFKQNRFITKWVAEDLPIGVILKNANTRILTYVHVVKFSQKIIYIY